MRHKRKVINLSVKKELQTWLLLRILGMVLLSSLVAALILYFYARHEVAATFYDAHIKMRRVSDLLLPVVAAGSLVSLLCGMALAMFVPQKIAGPIYRIENGLRTLASGDLTGGLRLRKGDILTDLADTVNETSSALQERIRLLKENQGELERLLAANDLPGMSKVLADQREKLDRFRI